MPHALTRDCCRYCGHTILDHTYYADIGCVGSLSCRCQGYLGPEDDEEGDHAS